MGIRGSPAGSGDCCLKSEVPCPNSVSTCTSGAKKEQKKDCGGSTGTVACTVEYAPPSDESAAFYEVPVSCGGTKDTLRLTPSEKTLELRIFADWTFLEAYFQKGRVAMTVTEALKDDTEASLTTTAPVTVQEVIAYPMKSIWVSPDVVRDAARVYN